MAINPDCKDCHGTGQILLLNKTVQCFCVDREIKIVEEDNDPLELKKLFDQKLKENNEINWPII